MDIKSSLFSGGTSWRVLSRLDISLSRERRILSNRPTRAGDCFSISVSVSDPHKDNTNITNYYYLLPNIPASPYRATGTRSDTRAGPPLHTWINL